MQASSASAAATRPPKFRTGQLSVVLPASRPERPASAIVARAFEDAAGIRVNATGRATVELTVLIVAIPWLVVTSRSETSNGATKRPAPELIACGLGINACLHVDTARWRASHLHFDGETFSGEGMGRRACDRGTSSQEQQRHHSGQKSHLTPLCNSVESLSIHPKSHNKNPRCQDPWFAEHMQQKGLSHSAGLADRHPFSDQKSSDKSPRMESDPSAAPRQAGLKPRAAQDISFTQASWILSRPASRINASTSSFRQ